MNTFRTIAISICAAAILSGAVSMLLPKGNVAKSVKVLISLFMIAVIAMPFTGKISFDFDFASRSANEQIDDITSTVQRQLINSTEQAITEQVKGVMEQCEIYDSKIKIYMDIEEDGRISINQVSIGVPRDRISMSSIIKQLISSRLGLLADVYALED